MRGTSVIHHSARGMLASDLEIQAARWVQRKLGNIRHERRVLAIASRLHDLTRPVLRLGMSELRLLRLAALLHDVGRSINDKDHPEEGAKMILATTAMQFSPLDRRALAFLTRYHRGQVPEIGSEKYLHTADPRQNLYTILGLLRTADALDNRQIASPKVMFEMNERQLQIRCYVENDFREARRIYRRRKKYLLLESMMKGRIDVEVHRADTLPLAA